MARIIVIPSFDTKMPAQFNPAVAVLVHVAPPFVDFTIIAFAEAYTMLQSLLQAIPVIALDIEGAVDNVVHV
jgi:hypothetical protein